MNSSELKPQLESMMRLGQLSAVREVLREIPPAAIKRTDLADIANYARRAGAANISIRLLTNIVRPKERISTGASHKEIAIYAAALIKLGAARESIELLSGIQDHKTPECLLYLAFAYIKCWNYEAAIPLLKSYIQHDTISDYERAIAQLNLAAAFRFRNRGAPEQNIARQILVQAEQNNWILHKRSALEILAQSSIGQEDWKQVRTHLKQAHDHCIKHHLDTLFIQKWQTIAHIYEVGPLPGNLRQLLRIRDEAAFRGDWETVRDCDYSKAISTRDQYLCDYLFFGTPHAPFKKRLLNETSNWYQPERSFTRYFTGSTERIFDLNSGKELGTGLLLNRKLVSYRLLKILASDFYKPYSYGEIFSDLFPNENFHIVHSISRVRIAMSRFRAWAKENQVPLQIQSQRSLYQLSASAPYGLRFCSQSEQIQTDDNTFLGLIHRLKELYPYKVMTSHTIGKALELTSERTTALLKWATKEGLILRSGRGRGTFYRFSK